MNIFNKEKEGIKLTSEEAIEAYSETVYKIALNTMKNTADAQDVYQEVFLRFVKNKKTIESKEHMKAWFIRVTLNCCNSMHTQKYRKETQPLVIDKAMEEKEDTGILFLVKELDYHYRIAIHLFYYEEYSIKEIASLLNEKEGTIKTRLSRARLMLKQRWEEEGYAK